jgi:hypothetical protein
LSDGQTLDICRKCAKFEKARFRQFYFLNFEPLLSEYDVVVFTFLFIAGDRGGVI